MKSPTRFPIINFDDHIQSVACSRCQSFHGYNFPHLKPSDADRELSCFHADLHRCFGSLPIFRLQGSFVFCCVVIGHGWLSQTLRHSGELRSSTSSFLHLRGYDAPRSLNCSPTRQFATTQFEQFIRVRLFIAFAVDVHFRGTCFFAFAIYITLACDFRWRFQCIPANGRCLICSAILLIRPFEFFSQGRLSRWKESVFREWNRKWGFDTPKKRYRRGGWVIRYLLIYAKVSILFALN